MTLTGRNTEMLKTEMLKWLRASGVSAFQHFQSFRFSLD
jgi:hypothetical protein